MDGLSPPPRQPYESEPQLEGYASVSQDWTAEDVDQLQRDGRLAAFLPPCGDSARPASARQQELVARALLAHIARAYGQPAGLAVDANARRRRDRRHVDGGGGQHEEGEEQEDRWGSERESHGAGRSVAASLSRLPARWSCDDAAIRQKIYFKRVNIKIQLSNWSVSLEGQYKIPKYLRKHV